MSDIPANPPIEAEQSPEAIAARWARLDALARSIVHEETRAQYLALWRIRFERECYPTVRHIQPEVQLHSGRLLEEPSADGSYWIPDSATDSERRLFQIVQYMLKKRRAKADFNAEINADIKDVLAMAKAAGFNTKAINAAVRDIEADAEKREEHEMHWSLYRRVLGISGPMNEATLPQIVDARPRLSAAAARGKAMKDYRLALLEADDVC